MATLAKGRFFKGPPLKIFPYSFSAVSFSSLSVFSPLARRIIFLSMKQQFEMLPFKKKTRERQSSCRSIRV